MITIIGDWNGDGVDTIGLYNPTTSMFFLSDSNVGGFADDVFVFGPANSGMVPIVGDWDGNGTDTVGLYNPTTSMFFLKNSNSTGFSDTAFVYGPANERLDAPGGRLERRRQGHHRSVQSDHVDVLPAEQQQHRIFRYGLRLWPGPERLDAPGGRLERRRQGHHRSVQSDHVDVLPAEQQQHRIFRYGVRSMARPTRGGFRWLEIGRVPDRRKWRPSR